MIQHSKDCLLLSTFKSDSLKKFRILPSTVLLRLLSLFTFLSNFTSYAIEPMIDIVAEQAPPIAFIDKTDSQIKGAGVELIRLVMDDAKLTYNISVLPWARALRKARTSPNTIIFALGRTAERENDFLWLHNIMDISYHLYYLGTNKALNHVQLDTIRSLPIAVIKDDVANSYLKNKLFENMVYVNDYDQMFKLLQKERIALIASNALGVNTFLKSYPQFDVEIKKVKEPLGPSIGIYFAANTQTDNSVIKKISNSFNLLVKSDKYKKIMTPLHQLLKIKNP